jgi:hypothetical protein
MLLNGYENQGRTRLDKLAGVFAGWTIQQYQISHLLA